MTMIDRNPAGRVADEGQVQAVTEVTKDTVLQDILQELRAIHQLLEILTGEEVETEDSNND